MLTSCLTWVTQTLVDKLKGRSSIDVKIMVTAEYLANTLGCTHPHEQTYKHWLAMILLLHFDVWPRYKQVFELLNLFKVEVKSVRKKCALPKALYPKTPHAVSEHVFAHLFPDEPPIAIELERFYVTAKSHVPLRKNSKLIKNEEALGNESPEATPCIKHEPIPIKRELDHHAPPSWATEMMGMMMANRVPPHVQPSIKTEPTQPSGLTDTQASSHDASHGRQQPLQGVGRLCSDRKVEDANYCL